MSSEFGIQPRDMADLKPWHITAMIRHVEELNKARSRG